MSARVVLRFAAVAVAAAVFVLPLAAAQAIPNYPLTRVAQDRIVDGAGLHRSAQQAFIATAAGSKTIVGTFQVGRIFDGGASAIGDAYSVNGGKSWKSGLVPLTVASGGPMSGGLFPLWRAADPTVAYNARFNRWLIASRGLDDTGSAVGLFLNTSTNGSSWSAPSTIRPAGAGDAPSKGALTCDNNGSSQGYGTCYIAYTNTASTPANQLVVIRSTDGGSTWSSPVGTPDASAGTGAIPLVQPPAPGTAPGSACGRLVVSYANGTTVDDIASIDCGATFGAHSVVTSTLAAQHTVAQGLRTSLLPSVSMDKAGALYLAYQTRSFRITQTTLAADAAAGATNVKVASVTGMAAGGTLTVDTGGSAETVTIATVGTAGAAGTGVTFAPALASAHAIGAFVTVNGVPSASTAAPNDIALSVMPGPTAAIPAPSFGTPARVAIEADAGASSNTVDHFIPGIAADPTATGRLGLFYYSYPVANCVYAANTPTFLAVPAVQCAPQAGYVSSTNGGTTWSAPTTLASMSSLALLPRGTDGPDLGNQNGAAVIPFGPLEGNAITIFALGVPVTGLDESMYVPTHGLAITGAP